jgi:hypothetical protein
VELDTVQKITDAFYRLVGTVEADTALVRRNEAVGEVAELCLTHGCRNAQRWMLRCGYGGWRKRSAALSFSGADATDGGRFTELPTDFLLAYGNQHPSRSALVEASGARWGRETEPEQDHLEGNLYYIRGDELWLARKASVPTTLYLDYHYRHPAWDDDLADEDIVFPIEARPLIPAEAAYYGMSDNWLPGDRALETKIAGRRAQARDDARHVAKRTRQPRTILRPRRLASRW